MAWALGFGLVLLGTGAVQAAPEDDLAAYQGHFKQRFPDVPFQEYANGIYAIDPVSRSQWEAIEEFPPYELAIEEGEELFNTPLKNGKTYADCFPNGGIGIKQNYPYFDTKTGQVKTLELAINECREKNGDRPLPYKKGKMAALSAYMAYTSRGNIINVVIPDDPRARAAYEKGKRFYYSKRGQLNFSCSDCHVDHPGQRVRAEVLSPGLGQTTHWPVYRAKWGEIGTLHRRYAGCNGQVRAKPFPAQSEEYRNLEYFHTYMSNGLKLNGPGARR